MQSSTQVASSVASVVVGATYVYSGTRAIAQVALNGGAPTGGAKVSLTSSKSDVLSVPGSVLVPAGATSVLFAVTAGTVTTTSSATITAAYNNTFAGTTVAVKPSTTTPTPPPTPTPTPTPTVTVSISPASVTIVAGQSKQFTATVSGNTNTRVTWAATAGTISTSGLFTAPNVSATTKVTVAATSQASTSAKGYASVTVTPPSTTPPPPTGGSNTYSGSGPVASWKAYQYRDTDGLYHQALLISKSTGAYPVIGYSYASSSCTNVGDTFNDFWQPLGNGLWWFIHDPEFVHVKWVWYDSASSQKILQQTPCIDYSGAPKYN